jgi:hypothetical protein
MSKANQALNTSEHASPTTTEPRSAGAKRRLVPSNEFRELRALSEAQYRIISARGELLEGDNLAAPLTARIDEYEIKICQLIERINSKSASFESLLDRAAVLLTCCDGFTPKAFDSPEQVLISVDGVRSRADSLEIAAGHLASTVFELMERGGGQEDHGPEVSGGVHARA